MSEAAAGFEPHRRYLTGLAYRMLGSLAEAEDAVQEAFLRWHGAARGEVENPRAWLARVTARLCLDHLKSARVKRETYVGPWLPEPLLEDLPAESETEWAEDLSVALLLVLERLSPLERAAFILHDVFDMEFAGVSAALGRSEAACRQLAARGRAHVREAKPRYRSTEAEGMRLAQAFAEASKTGDPAAIMALLAADVELRSDGGGKRLAALNPIVGADRVARFLAGILRAREHPEAWRHRFQRINGLPGIVATDPEGEVQTMAIEVADGRIAAIYIVRNPEKLGAVPP